MEVWALRSHFHDEEASGIEEAPSALSPCRREPRKAFADRDNQLSIVCAEPQQSVQERRKFRARNSTFAGRSASRRMKYGYQSVPNGT
jgi:hypothetical protein